MRSYYPELDVMHPPVNDYSLLVFPPLPLADQRRHNLIASTALTDPVRDGL
jgi:hypothetical protein